MEEFLRHCGSRVERHGYWVGRTWFRDGVPLWPSAAIRVEPQLRGRSERAERSGCQDRCRWHRVPVRLRGHPPGRRCRRILLPRHLVHSSHAVRFRLQGTRRNLTACSSCQRGQAVGAGRPFCRIGRLGHRDGGRPDHSNIKSWRNSGAHRSPSVRSRKARRVPGHVRQAPVAVAAARRVQIAVALHPARLGFGRLRFGAKSIRRQFGVPVSHHGAGRATPMCVDLGISGRGQEAAYGRLRGPTPMVDQRNQRRCSGVVLRLQLCDVRHQSVVD